VGEIITRLEKSFEIVAMKMMYPSRELIEQHYEEHRDRPFFDELCGEMADEPFVAIVLRGSAYGTVDTVRAMVGATDPEAAALNTLRRDFGMSVRCNAVHASDSESSARREIGLWFPGEVIFKEDSTTCAASSASSAPGTPDE